MREAHRDQELFAQQLPGRHGLELMHGRPFSMIVRDRNVLRAESRPAEAQAEPIVYTDTVLPGAVTPERS